MTGDLEQRIRVQARYCRGAGSPLTGTLLDAAADDYVAGGVVHDLLAPLASDPPGSAPALRFAGALHRRVLERRAPALALHYPTVGGTPGDVGRAMLQTVADSLEDLRELVRRPVQTNEIGRSSALLGGLLHAGRQTGLPVRLLELGASGGLNLQVDRFRHEVGGDVVLGDGASSVVLDVPWEGELPPVRTPLRIVERAGCDPSPLDPASTEHRLTLTSYVWADQLHRFERLRAALHLAAGQPVPVEPIGAADFLERELATPRREVVTVVWHSVVRQYLEPAERDQVQRLLEQAGDRATADAPLAHLWLEPERSGDGFRFVLGLRTWPGGRTTVLADCHGHGPPVVWRPSR